MKLINLNNSNVDRKVLDPIVAKLSSLIKNRYECELKYLPLEDLAPEQSKLLCSINPDSRPIEMENCNWIPIAIDNEVVGAARIEKSEEISLQGLLALKQVVQMVLESSLISASSMEVLDILEDQLAEGPKSNLVQLSKIRKIVRENTADIFDKAFNDGSKFNLPVLIQAQGHDCLLKMAIELHERSRRYAFIHFDQIDFNVRTNPDRYHELGNVSLFVPDISTLKDSEIFALTNYLKRGVCEDGPQIIGGTLHQVEELIERQLIPTELIGLMNAAFLRLTKPFAEYVRDGLAQYFFESLSKSKANRRPELR